jgi:hypothetical protein
VASQGKGNPDFVSDGELVEMAVVVKTEER